MYSLSSGTGEETNAHFAFGLPFMDIQCSHKINTAYKNGVGTFGKGSGSGAL